MNYWFWLYLFITPLIVLSASFTSKPWKRIIKLLAAILVCYVLMNLAVHLNWNSLQQAVNANPNRTDEDLHRVTADGANILYMLILGWIPALTYVGWWEAARLFINRNGIIKSKAHYFSLGVVLLSALFTLFALIVYGIIFESPLAFLQIVLPPAAYVIGSYL